MPNPLVARRAEVVLASCPTGRCNGRPPSLAALGLAVAAERLYVSQTAMGLYATLLDAPLQCPVCGGAVGNEWQFYFGAVGQLPAYRLGDQIRWDDGPRFGDDSMALVYALAYCVEEPACRSCSAESMIAEIRIEDGLIRSIGSPRAVAHVPELLLQGADRTPRFHDELYRARSRRA